MSKQSHDDINKIVNDIFDKAIHRQEDWTKAPQFVFDEAIEKVKLEPEKENRRNLLPLFLFLLFVGVSSLIYFSSKDLINKESSSLTKVPVASESLEQHGATKIVEIPKLIDEEVEVNSVQKESNQPNTVLTFKDNRVSKGLSQYVSRTSETTIIDSDDVKKDLKEVLELPLENVEQYISTKSNFVTRETASEELQLASIARLSLSTNFESKRDRFTLETAPKILENEVSNQNKFSLAILSTSNHTCLSMSGGEMDGSMSLTGYDQRYLGAGLKASFNYHLNSGWTINFLTGYDAYSNESIFNHASNYDLSNEVFNPDGSVSYDSDVTVHTPLGSYQTATNFRVAEGSHTASDILNTRTNIIQNFQVASIGLGLAKRFTLSDKWNIWTSGAMRYNHVLNFNSDFETWMTMEGETMDHIIDIAKGDDMDEHCSNFMSYEINVGLEYQLNSKISLLTGFQYNRSISSLRNQKLGLKAATHLHNYGLNMGVEIKF